MSPNSVVVEKAYILLVLNVAIIATAAACMVRLMNIYKQFSLRLLFVLILLIAIWLTVDHWIWSRKLFKLRRFFEIVTYVAPIPLWIVVESALQIRNRWNVTRGLRTRSELQ